MFAFTFTLYNLPPKTCYFYLPGSLVDSLDMSSFYLLPIHWLTCCYIAS